MPLSLPYWDHDTDGMPLDYLITIVDTPLANLLPHLVPGTEDTIVYPQQRLVTVMINGRFSVQEARAYIRYLSLTRPVPLDMVSPTAFFVDQQIYIRTHAVTLCFDPDPFFRWLLQKYDPLSLARCSEYEYLVLRHILDTECAHGTAMRAQMGHGPVPQFQRHFTPVVVQGHTGHPQPPGRPPRAILAEALGPMIAPPVEDRGQVVQDPDGSTPLPISSGTWSTE